MDRPLTEQEREFAERALAVDAEINPLARQLIEVIKKLKPTEDMKIASGIALADVTAWLLSSLGGTPEQQELSVYCFLLRLKEALKRYDDVGTSADVLALLLAQFK